MTWMPPLITRRSSTRGLPRVSVGRCGFNFANCSSVSQNWSRFIALLQSETVNHVTPLDETPLWVRTLGPHYIVFGLTLRRHIPVAGNAACRVFPSGRRAFQEIEIDIPKRDVESRFATFLAKYQRVPGRRDHRVGEH